MEKMVNKRLNWYIETSHILANEQTGFRTNRSTNQQVTKLSQHIKDALNRKHILTAIFVDFSTAYDSVWKERLLQKLLRAGVNSKMLHWIEAFIRERSCKVNYNNHLSNSKLLQTGVPQGAAT